MALINYRDTPKHDLSPSNINGDGVDSSPVSLPEGQMKVDPGSSGTSVASGASTITSGARASNTFYSSSIDSSIAADSAALHSTPGPTSSSVTTAIAAEATQTSIPYSYPQTGLTTSRLTAAIVVPIILIAIVSPILIVWFISWRRKNPPRKQIGRCTGREKILLEAKKGSPSVSSRGEEQNLAHRNSSRLNRSLSGFNFDLSRPVSTLTVAMPKQAVQRPLSSYHQGTTSFQDLPPSYAPRPITVAESVFPPRIDTPIFPVMSPSFHSEQGSTPTTITHYHHNSDPEICYRRDTSFEAHPRYSSPVELRRENLSIHNNNNNNNNNSPIPTTNENLQSTFSDAPSPVVSEISSSSFDRSLWIATQQDRGIDRRSFVSSIDHGGYMDTNTRELC